MNRSDLIVNLSMQFPNLSAADVDLVVRTLLDEMGASLGKHNRIEIRGFGSFVLNHRPPRLGRNPFTGAPVQIPARIVPHFRVGKEFRERVNNSAGVEIQP